MNTTRDYTLQPFIPKLVGPMLAKPRDCDDLPIFGKPNGIVKQKSEVLAILVAEFGDRIASTASTGLYFGDENYYLPTCSEADQIIRASPAFERPNPRSERFDCDDYAYLLKAAFCNYAYVASENTKYYPVCFGIIWCIAGWRSNADHAANWYINEKSNVVIVEPDANMPAQMYPGADRCHAPIALILV